MTLGPDAIDPTEDERRLLDALRSALPIDQLPSGLIERSQGLVALLDLDRELAELLDTADAELVGMRGGASQQEALRFEVADGAIAIELALDRDGIAGTVLAGDVADVILVGRDGDLHSSHVDAFGQFGFPAVNTRLVRLRLQSPSARPINTDWFLQ